MSRVLAVAGLTILSACSAHDTGAGGSAALRGDLTARLERGQVAIEYIAHACFRIHSPDGTRVVIDPYAGRVWIGYDLPENLAADAVLISHPHYDHDAGQRRGHDFPWDESVQVFRGPGVHSVGDIRITGIEGRHADPYGMEFGQINTIWLLEIAGLRIVHIGDNGPLTDKNIAELGRVDALMLPIDSQHHILGEEDIEGILSALNPTVVIPMHYRIPSLEPIAGRPRDLGDIDGWLAGRRDITRHPSNLLILGAGAVPATHFVVLRHSPLVAPPPLR